MQKFKLQFGAYGAKSWKKTSMGLDYRGDYRKYSQANRFSGVNQALALDFTYRPARRLTYFNRLTAGTTNRAFGAFSAPAFSDQDNFGVPLNEVYDSRANFAQVSGGVAYQSVRPIDLYGHGRRLCHQTEKQFSYRNPRLSRGGELLLSANAIGYGRSDLRLHTYITFRGPTGMLLLTQP